MPLKYILAIMGFHIQQAAELNVSQTVFVRLPQPQIAAPSSTMI